MNLKLQYLLSKGYITPWLIKQMFYCPTIPWIITNVGYEEPLTPSMSLGRDTKASSKENIANNLGLPHPRLYELYLRSNRYGIVGIIDIVAGRKRLNIVEVKAFKRKSYEHYKAQLMTYALLATDSLSIVHRAYLVLRNEVLIYQVTHQDLEQARRNIERLWKIIDSPEPPITKQPIQKCKYCKYRNYCPFNDTEF